MRTVPREPRTRVARLLVAVAAAAMAVVTTAPPAAAHAEFESSTPPAGARLDKLPETVTLTFTETMRTPAFVEITGPGGETVSSGEAQTRDADVVARVGESAGAGRYTVSYRVTSADGHPIAGTVRFSVQGGPGAVDAVPAAATQSSGGGMDTTQLLLLLGALAIGLLAVASGTQRALKRSVATVEDRTAGRTPRR